MASKKVLVIGAGLGGLSSAIRLAQLGYKVQILEARQQAGGFASGVKLKEFSFDSSFYILLDKQGLEWALKQLQIEMHEALQLQPIHEIYHVLHADGTEFMMHSDFLRTAESLEQKYKGSAAAYKSFISQSHKVHQAVQSLSFKSQPNFMDMLLSNSLVHLPFLISSLETILKRTSLPLPVQKSLGIFTLLSGQPLSEAASTMALVPSLMHYAGAYYPIGGIQELVNVLLKKAEEVGVDILYKSKVKTIVTENKIAKGVTLDGNEFISADAIVLNSSAIGGYVNLLDKFPEYEKQKLKTQPLQSTGICIYLAVKGKKNPYYLRFKLSDGRCIAFVQPALLDPQLEKEGWFPAKLFTHLDYTTALQMGQQGQLDFMDEVVEDEWWKTNISEYKVLHKRSTFEWGEEFYLYSDSMNPVMSSKFMLKEHMPYKSPYIQKLYHAGSSTPLGQGISLCMISGLHAANSLANG